MADNKSNPEKGTQTENHQSLAENIGVSGTMEDFGGGRGQFAGTQESASSQDQFSDELLQITDENDFAGEVTPQPPTDYFDKENREEE